MADTEDFTNSGSRMPKTACSHVQNVSEQIHRDYGLHGPKAQCPVPGLHVFPLSFSTILADSDSVHHGIERVPRAVLRETER